MSSFNYGEQVKVVGQSIKAGCFGLIRDVAPSGHFYVVALADGDVCSFHESDLTEWDGWDEDDEGDDE